MLRKMPNIKETSPFSLVQISYSKLFAQITYVKVNQVDFPSELDGELQSKTKKVESVPIIFSEMLSNTLTSPFFC